MNSVLACHCCWLAVIAVGCHCCWLAVIVFALSKYGSLDVAFGLMGYWSVAMAHCNEEERALNNLERQGFTCYAPRYRISKKVNGTRRYILKWLFPPYLFVHVDGAWRSLLGTIGIARILKSNDEPAKVSDETIAAIRANEDYDGFIKLSESRYHKGQRLLILEGPFSGMVATHYSVDQQRNELALLNMMGRNVVVKLDSRHVTPI